MRMTEVGREGGREKTRQNLKKKKEWKNGEYKRKQNEKSSVFVCVKEREGASEEGEVNLRGVVEEEDEEKEDEDEDEDEERKEKKRRSDKKALEKKDEGGNSHVLPEWTIRAKAERMSELQKLDEGHE